MRSEGFGNVAGSRKAFEELIVLRRVDRFANAFRKSDPRFFGEWSPVDDVVGFPCSCNGKEVAAESFVQGNVGSRGRMGRVKSRPVEPAFGGSKEFRSRVRAANSSGKF